MDRTTDDSLAIQEERLINKSSNLDHINASKFIFKSFTGQKTSFLDDLVSPNTQRNANADINVKPGKHVFSPNG